VLLLAAVAVVAATVVLASGRGGELREPLADRPPTGLPEDRPLTGTDAAMLRLPKGVFGYDIAVTDEALGKLAYALMRRENEVAELRRQLSGAGVYGPGEGLSASWLKKPEEPGADDAERPWRSEGPPEGRERPREQDEEDLG